MEAEAVDLAQAGRCRARAMLAPLVDGGVNPQQSGEI
jgi:hypothetical protein